MSGLSPKQRAFIEAYLKEWNASEAARQAGYTGKANVVGPRLLANVSIQAAIEKRLSENKMSSNEVLSRLAEQARGEHGKYLLPSGTVNFAALIADGKGHLVKGIKQTRYGLDVDFYDAQAANIWTGKHLGLFKERIDITSGDERIGASGEEYRRSITALAEALRSIVHPTGAGPESVVDPAESAAMDGAPQSGR